MKLIYSKNRLGTVLERSSYPLLLFRVTEDRNQIIYVFDLEQRALLTEISYENKDAFTAELFKSQLFIYNQNVLRKYSKTGVLLAEISDTPYFSKGYCFRKANSTSEHLYEVFSK